MQIDISKIKYYFTENKSVNRIFLFGSYARNEENEESDIDLLLELNDNEKTDLMDFIGWKLDLEKLLKKNVDLVTTDGMSKFVKPFVDAEKKLIYEKG